LLGTAALDPYRKCRDLFDHLVGAHQYRFASLEASLGGKWLELLSEIAPGLKRAAIMFNPDTLY
jgi:hypothetical protein